MALLIYIIALVITVLLMHVADAVHPSSGDVRLAVFLAILFIVNWVLGMLPRGSVRREP